MKNPSNKKRIMFIFKSVPYPLRADGVSVRYLPIIEYMAERHEVDLMIISGDKEKPPDLNGLRKYCRRIIAIPDPRQSPQNLLTKSKTYANFLLPWTPPLSLVSHGGSEATRGIIDAARGEHYDTVVWVGGYLLPNLLDAIPSMSVERVFVDFIDSQFLQAIRRNENIFPIRILDRYERWKTCQWEGKVIREVGAAIYVSRVDAGAVPQRLAPLGKRHVVPNGVFPDSCAERRRNLPAPNIGFLGNMMYPPNIEAAEWLYESVFVPLRDLRPGLTLVLIGRDPSPAITRLGEKPGVIVTGTVEHIWEYINSVDVFLFPLLRGTGLKNKILEAMYARRPVITTEIGNEGIDAVPGKDIVICRSGEDFIREAVRLLDSPGERARLGGTGHDYVVAKFSWDEILRTYENIILDRISNG